MNTPRRKKTASADSLASETVRNSIELETLPAGNLRSFLSLCVVIHFTCAMFALAANVFPSRLFFRLSDTVSPYGRASLLDPETIALSPAQSAPAGDDHFFEITFLPPLDAPERRPTLKTLLLPEPRTAGSFTSRRIQRLAREVALHAVELHDSVTAAQIKGVAVFALKSQRQSHAVVKCVRRTTQPFERNASNAEFPEDPTDPAYQVTLYEAEVWIDDDGELQLQKRSEAAGSAPGTVRESAEKKENK